ncbi:uncharacterized protein BJ171DRAFT_514030 [Polychytrium aggregatum]|uniref:uncharacterized protein n=1 Tax=Polychytrium aggregatum TaxID=110093 RepID=UPI0022FE2B16|nr:uncharacterized protein BJ171DRAFT_514030 [Polychytrium aggregatum]KAI9202423.1 hypothetical protein BJ171DRAFT_514030 [Polychytrium aggregatum]
MAYQPPNQYAPRGTYQQPYQPGGYSQGQQPPYQPGGYSQAPPTYGQPYQGQQYQGQQYQGQQYQGQQYQGQQYQSSGPYSTQRPPYQPGPTPYSPPTVHPTLSQKSDGYQPVAPARIATLPPPGQPSDPYVLFQRADRDNSGRIDAAELQQALVNGDYTAFSPETVGTMLQLFDTDEDGRITSTEFQSLWKYLSDWRGIFDRFDADRSGNIDSGELTQALAAFGFRISDATCRTLIQRFSKKGRSDISFDSFIRVCMSIKSATETFVQLNPTSDNRVTLDYEQFLTAVIRK